MKIEREKLLLNCDKQKGALMSSPNAIYTVIARIIIMMVTTIMMIMIISSLRTLHQHH